MLKENNITWRNRAEYFIMKYCLLMIKISPSFTKPVYSSIIKNLFRILLPGYKKIVEHNLLLAFPEYNINKINLILKETYTHYSRMISDLLFLFSGKKQESVLKPVTIINSHIIEKYLKMDRGFVLFSGHLGNWELIPLLMSEQFNLNIFGIAKRMRNPLIDKFLVRFRDRMGCTIIDKEGSARKILELLDNNKCLYYLIDQNTIDREGVVVNFFSKRVTAVSAVSKLHIKKNTPVLPVFLTYNENNIELKISDELNDNSDTEHETIESFTQKCNHIIEQEIRKHPEQWFWFHRRWKNIK